MVKKISTYTLAFFLSLSILGPSFLGLLENEGDIELVQDIEQESTKDNKLEVDEKEKFIEDYVAIAVTAALEEEVASHFYLDPKYIYVQEVHSPPPDQMV